MKGRGKDWGTFSTVLEKEMSDEVLCNTETKNIPHSQSNRHRKTFYIENVGILEREAVQCENRTKGGRWGWRTAIYTVMVGYHAEVF